MEVQKIHPIIRSYYIIFPGISTHFKMNKPLEAQEKLVSRFRSAAQEGRRPENRELFEI